MSKGKRDESRSSKTQNIRRRMTKTSREESQMDDEGKKRKETRSSTEPNTRRRIATKTSPEESKSHERTVAVTAQESSDGMREKTMRIESNSPARCSSLGGAEHDKTEKTNELTIQKEERRYRRLWQQVKTVERDEFEASNTTFYMKYVDIVRRPASALRVFTSSERLGNW